MAETKVIQESVNQVAVQAAEAVIITLREADARLRSGTSTASPRD